MVQTNLIIQGDCLQKLKNFPPNSIDMVFTSPPYNLSNNSVRGDIYTEYKDDKSRTEYINFIRNVIKELLRVTKHYVFFNFQMLTNNKIEYLEIMHEFMWNIKDIIIWCKNQCPPSMQSTCLGSQYEFILALTKKEEKNKRTFDYAFFNNHKKGESTNNVIHGNNASHDKLREPLLKDHGAIFPKYLARWFIQRFTKENDIVLDPFSGMATTSVVAKEMNRQYIGIEIDPTYVEMSKKRLSQKQLPFAFGQQTLEFKEKSD